MKNRLITFALVLFVAPSLAQVSTDPLFSSTDPLDIAFGVSIKAIKNSKYDSVYFKEKMYFRNAAGEMDSIKIGLKRRGNFRLRECFFPPMWMKIGTKDAKNTLFEGNRKLKLVLPCDSRSASNDLILREYLCYKMYEVATSYCFRTRLVNVDFTEERGKKNKEYKLKGIIIEDVGKTAKRNGSKTTSSARVPANTLNDTFALRFDLFQLLIANTDFSKRYQHNCKLIFQNAKYIPLPYDFDMSGVVSAPYSVVSQVGDAKLPIESVKERLYRGHCTSAAITELVRQEYLSNEEKLLAVPDQLKESLSEKEIKNLKEYLEEFFEILKDDSSFDREVVSKCRPK